MALKHVERIRDRILRGQMSELTRIRGFISLTDGNIDAVDRLRGPMGDEILAAVTDLILRKLGHETDTPVEDPASHVRRSVSRVRGKGAGPADED